MVVDQLTLVSIQMSIQTFKEPVMKAKSGHWAMIALVFLTGCLPSLNPVFTEKDLIFDPAFIGLWKQPKAGESWEFTQADDKSYNLVYTDEAGHTGRFAARLAQIEGTIFLDLFPKEIQDDQNAFYKFHLVPIHTIYLVRKTKPNLELDALDYRWLDEYLAKHPDAIAHSTFNGRKLITASTADLQAFVLQHKAAFNAKFVLERQVTK
jgi:hypothetical protein